MVEDKPGRHFAAAVAALGLAACDVPAPPEPPAPNISSAAAAPAQNDIAGSASASADLPPCPSINPDIRRPPGSNCLGIVPAAACGADVAARFVGQRADDRTRAAVAQAVDHDRIRWIRPRDAVTDDLRPGRLNIALDAQGRIAKADCY